jgi:hypothetical protein
VPERRQRVEARGAQGRNKRRDHIQEAQQRCDGGQRPGVAGADAEEQTLDVAAQGQRGGKAQPHAEARAPQALKQYLADQEPRRCGSDCSALSSLNTSMLPGFAPGKVSRRTDATVASRTLLGSVERTKSASGAALIDGWKYMGLVVSSSSKR